MSQSDFPRHLIDEADRLLIQIRAAGDQIEALVSRARDVLTLAKRTILENGKFDQEMEIGERRIRQADTAIEREAQREVERREKSIDEGRIGHAEHPSRGPDILFGSGTQPLTGAVPLAKHGEFDPSPRLVIGIVNNEAGSFIRGEDGVLKPMFDSDGDAARDIVRNIAEPDESDGADERLTFGVIQPGGAVHMGTGVSDLSEDLARGPIVADAIDATKIEESLPGQAEGVSTGAAEELSPQPAEAAPVNTTWPEFEVATIADNAVRSGWPNPKEHAAADEPTVPAEDAHDEASAGPQVSAEMNGPAEEAAEEAKVIPPEDSSAVIAPASERLGRVPQPAGDEAPALNPPMIDTTDWTLRQQDLDRLSTTARQNANAKEAAEFSDKVLDLWSTTLLTEAQIAKRLATGKALIMTVLEQARMDQDPRVTGKRGVQPKPKEHMPLSAIARKIMDRPAPVAAARAGVELGDFKPPAPEPDRVEKDLSTGVCTVDLRTNKIYGKRGMWTTDEARARTVAFLNGGQMFPKDVIAQRCGWSSGRDFLVAITPMIERLRDIGIVMTSTLAGIVIRVDD